MSECDHRFGDDDICNNCGYSIGYLFIKAEQEIATLQSDLAASREEQARARESLLREWREKGSFSHGLTVAAEIAQAKYKREIAQEQG